MSYKEVLDAKLQDDIKNTDRLYTIISRLGYWGIDGLNEEGIKKWTEDINWLAKEALKGHKYGVVLESIQRNIDDKEEIQNWLNKAFELK